MPIFWQQLQTLSSLKEKIPFRLFMAFPKCAWNLEHPGKKEDCPSIIVTEIIAYDRDIYLSV